jgi:WD40 repeat protein
MFFTTDGDVKAEIGSARYSPDGRNIAVEHKGTIIFHDAANGRELRRLPKQDTGVASSLNFAYSPNGRQIATYYSYSNAVKIRNVETGQLERTIPWPDLDQNPMVFSPDGTRIAARSGDIIRILNTANGSETGILPASDIPYMGHSNIMYHPNGKRLLAASAYGFTI